MKPTQSVEVRLLGQKIALKSSGGDPELAQEVAALVASRLKEAESRSRGSVPHHVALLALFNLAEEYLAAKQRTADHLLRVELKSREIGERVDAALK
jgi:cell division protein ZapA (FtsZ GTPase activity inhibitor)